MGEKVIHGIEKIDLNGKEKPKIIIIGAGISGIATADTLTRAGFTDFKILEASGRTGGRIWTVDVGKLVMRTARDCRCLSLFSEICVYLIHCFIHIYMNMFLLFFSVLPFGLKLIMNEGRQRTHVDTLKMTNKKVFIFRFDKFRLEMKVKDQKYCNGLYK